MEERTHKSYVANASVDQNYMVRKPSLTVMAYDNSNVVEVEIHQISEVAQYLQKYQMTWLNVIGVDNKVLLQQIADMFKLHDLAIEDVANTHERPKIEEYNETKFGITQTPQIINKNIIFKQFSFFWAKNFAVSFEEVSGVDFLEPIRTRIRHNTTRERLLNPDYLVYSILDTIIDNYFPIIEDYGTILDDIEDDAIANPTTRVIAKIHNYKHNLMQLRRAMWSQRESLRDLVEIGNFIDPDIRFFIRDCEDHTIQLIDILESYRERTSGLMDIYLSSISNKMNATIKILTAIATIFMPMTFITGLYGMNFDRSKSPWNLPELGWYYGYPYALCLIFSIGIFLGFFFWRRGWFNSKAV